MLLDRDKEKDASRKSNEWVSLPQSKLYLCNKINRFQKIKRIRPYFVRSFKCIC